MCWSETASVAMVAAGGAATLVAIRRGEPPAICLAVGYFTAMEGLQALGYLVVDDCGGTMNRTLTVLSYLHIVFQPVVINAALLTLLPATARARLAPWVFGVCAVSVLTMLAQLVPFEGAGPCGPGQVLCGLAWCLVSGEWHIGWTVPYTGLLAPVELAAGLTPGFPTYVFAVFVMPILYGAWRFVIFHAVFGPTLAQALTDNPTEWPAIWCLFSIALVCVVLVPRLRAVFTVRRWVLWPRGWAA